MQGRVYGKIWVVVFFVVALAIVWFTRHLLLLLFAAALFALILTSLINLFRRLVPIGRKWAFIIVLLILGGGGVGLGFFLGSSIVNEFSQLAERLPAIFSDVRQKVESSPTFQKLEALIPEPKEMAQTGSGGVMSVFSSTFGALSSLVFILFAALFMAVAPQLYIRMLILLFPPRLRKDVGDTVQRVVQTLKLWLLGQLISMIIIGTATGVAFAIAGIPFALELGILAGIGEFVPFIGPVLVSLPALLLGLSEGTDKFLIVLAIILAIQFIEANILMPVVQRKAVHLPPVVTLASIMVLGGAFGLLGVFVAAPFIAVVMVLIEEWYLKRYLKTDEKLVE